MVPRMTPHTCTCHVRQHFENGVIRSLIQFNLIDILDQLMDFPGGAVKFASYNATALVSDVTKGYVIPTSYFGNVYNITAIEVVAVTQGQLAIDVSNEKDITQTIENLEKWHINFFFFFRL